eukprot:scaffold136327_cov25-Prasinocladus_malaysianus.AAC.1
MSWGAVVHLTPDDISLSLQHACDRCDVSDYLGAVRVRLSFCRFGIRGIFHDSGNIPIEAGTYSRHAKCGPAAGCGVWRINQKTCPEEFVNLVIVRHRG